jgi:uncharacterized protein YcbK (DUF882 family)
MKQTFLIGVSAILLLIVGGIIFYWRIRLSGMQVTSWWRNPWKNAEVGGVKNSLHMVGLAWDVIPVNAENRAKLASFGLTVIDEADHLHAQV